MAVTTDAWNLHQATTRFPLDHFIVFASRDHGSFDAAPAGGASLHALLHQRKASALPAAIVPAASLDRGEAHREALAALDQVLAHSAAASMTTRMD